MDYVGLTPVKVDTAAALRRDREPGERDSERSLENTFSFSQNALANYSDLFTGNDGVTGGGGGDTSPW